MKIHHHPDDATIMAYAAGALSEGFSLVLAAHLDYCACCRDQLSDAQALGGALLMDLQPTALPAGGLGDVWERISSMSESETPVPPALPPNDGVSGVLLQFLESGLESVPWRSLAPGIYHHILDDIDSGKGSVRLLAISPGVVIPQHTHEGGELTLVLKGAYQDEVGLFRSGDLADLDPSVSHQPVAEGNEPCICLIATDAPLRFSGIINRMLQPLIGI